MTNENKQPDERTAFEKTLSVEDSFRQADGTYLNPDVQAVWTANRTASSTAGMTLGERIAHVGGRENANGYIEFGSVMAVHALIQHALRDAHATAPQATKGDERTAAKRAIGYVMAMNGPQSLIKTLHSMSEGTASDGVGGNEAQTSQRDVEISQLIDERDSFEHMGTVLAGKVGELLNVEVGEWSSANNPIFRAIHAVEDQIATTPSPVEESAGQAPAVSVELLGVADELKNGEGFWRTCSGCHESEDGHPVGQYPFSAILNCDLGSGCHECGGIGAVWDNTDYGAMADAFDAQEIASEKAEGAQAPIDYDRVVQICEAHGIGLPVDCVEMVVEIIRHAAPVAPTAPSLTTDAGAVLTDYACEAIRRYFGTDLQDDEIRRLLDAHPEQRMDEENERSVDPRPHSDAAWIDAARKGGNDAK